MGFEDSLVSIVIPVFDAESFLSQTLLSVVNQSYKNWEALAVVDVKTKDNSVNILKKFSIADMRIKFFEPSLSGASACRNFAIPRARGRWLCFLDADDYWLEHKLEYQLQNMIDAKAGFSTTGFRRIDQSNKRVGRLMSSPQNITYKKLLGQNSICISSVMMDRRSVGNIDFEDIGCEDYALWLKLTASGVKGVGFREDLVRYRIVSGSRGSSRIKTAQESWYLIRRDLNILSASFKFAEFLARGIIKHSRF